MHFFVNAYFPFFSVHETKTKIYSTFINYCYVTLTIIIILVILLVSLQTKSIKWLSFFPFSHISVKKQLPKPPEFEF